jgi:hypothetical protein
MKKKNIFTKILLQQTEFTACFRPRHASERNSELLFLPRYGYEQNSKCLLIILFHGLFSILGNGSEWNSERLLLILFHGIEFRAFFSSAERFRTIF